MTVGLSIALLQMCIFFVERKQLRSPDCVEQKFSHSCVYNLLSFWSYETWYVLEQLTEDRSMRQSIVLRRGSQAYGLHRGRFRVDLFCNALVLVLQFLFSLCSLSFPTDFGHQANLLLASGVWNGLARRVVWPLTHLFLAQHLYSD